MVSSERSPDVAGFGCGDAEICAVVPAISPVPASLRGFLAVVARCPLWRLSVFFVGAGPPDSEDD